MKRARAQPCDSQRALTLSLLLHCSAAEAVRTTQEGCRRGIRHSFGKKRLASAGLPCSERKRCGSEVRLRARLINDITRGSDSTGKTRYMQSAAQVEWLWQKEDDSGTSC